MRRYIERFVDSMAEKGRAKNTIACYRRDVARYIEFLEKNGIRSLDDTTKSTILTYLLSLQREGMTAATVNRMLSSLRAFYGYYTAGGGHMPDPTQNLEAPHIGRRLPRVLTVNEVERLLCAPDAVSAKGRRDRAMLEVLYAAGIKVSELVALDLKDVNTEAGFLHCRGGIRERILPIGALAVAALDKYLADAREQLRKDKPTEALFLNCSGDRMSRQGFWKLIKVYKDEAGITSDITPNILRHSFAVHMMENGADLAAIQEMLGHSDIATTRIYSKLVKSHIKDVYYKTHPRA